MNQQKKKKMRAVVSNALLAVLVFVAACLLIRNTCYTAVIVSGASMAPTLQDQEYGFALTTKYALTHIRRFQIVVFEGEDSRDLIKRVIGLPGETVEFRGETCELYINGAPVAQDFISEEQRILTCEQAAPGFGRDMVFSLDASSYFVLGDNRGNSRDSMHGLGLVDQADLLGVLSFTCARCEEIRSSDGRIVCAGKKFTGFTYF